MKVSMSNEACTPSIALYNLNTIDCPNFLNSIQGCILFDVGFTYCFESLKCSVISDEVLQASKL